MNRYALHLALPAVACLVSLAGCLTTPRKVDEYESVSYAANEFKQTRDGLQVEMLGAPQIVTNGNPIPEEFLQVAVKCDLSGKPLYGSGDPRVVTNAQGKQKVAIPLLQTKGQTEQVRLLQPGMWVQKVTITNQTPHVLRLNTAVVRLFDPGGTQYSPVDHDALRAGLLSARACVTTREVADGMGGIPLVNRDIEIVPKTSYTGFLVFKPARPVSGVWKVAMYELPVATNTAGQVTKTTQFEIRSVLKHYVATYATEIGKPAQVLSREEVR